MTIEKTLATQLRQRREAHGLSLKDLAATVGCAKSHLHEIEQGRATNVTLGLLRRLSATLDTSVSDLIGERTPAATIEALTAADQFIRNGIELGYITMPAAGDPALKVPALVRAALAAARGGA